MIAAPLSLNSTTSPLPSQPLSSPVPSISSSKAAFDKPTQTLESTTPAVLNRGILHLGRAHNNSLVMGNNSNNSATITMTPSYPLPSPPITSTMVPPPLPSCLHTNLSHSSLNHQIKTAVTADLHFSSTITSTNLPMRSAKTPIQNPEILEHVKITNPISPPLPPPTATSSSSSYSFKQRVNTFHHNSTSKIIHHTLNTMATTAFSAQPKRPVVLRSLKLVVPKKRKRSPPKRNESKKKRQ